MNTIGGYSAITHGESALQSAKANQEQSKFESLLNEMSSAQNSGVGSNVSSEQVGESGRLNGDYRSGFSGTFSTPGAKTSAPVGAAANQANASVKSRTIDRTSALYEKSLEMESYLVKMMLSSMRKTVIHADGDQNYARSMYEDMLYDEYATTMTKNAGFGLADEMYLQLSR
jgi:peptidoglycan hydrolase FlgJ